MHINSLSTYVTTSDHIYKTQPQVTQTLTHTKFKLEHNNAFQTHTLRQTHTHTNKHTHTHTLTCWPFRHLTGYMRIKGQDEKMRLPTHTHTHTHTHMHNHN